MGISLDYVVSLGTDGVALMVGRINGLATRLKKRSPYMLSMHCIAHKTNLCLVDAIKKSPYAQHIDDVVNDIARIFSNSSLQTAALTSLQQKNPDLYAKLKDTKLIYSIFSLSDILNRLASLSTIF